MSEFQNRIEAQRRVLAIVNSSKGFSEQLLGLSAKSLERWARVNSLAVNDPILGKLTEISASLFFLASKSQEQITEDYQLLLTKVANLMSELKPLVREQTSA